MSSGHGICPKCGEAELVYQPMLSTSCERCPACDWLTLGLSHFEVARMCREAEEARRQNPSTRRPPEHAEPGPEVS